MKTKIKSKEWISKVQLTAQTVNAKTNGVGAKILSYVKISAKGNRI